MMPAIARLLGDESRDPAQGASEGGGRIANGIAPGTRKARSNKCLICRTDFLVAWLPIAGSFLIVTPKFFPISGALFVEEPF
jgi:hypothetical protein